ncbi:MAG: hypothetical protein GY814_19330 [Gammaproteobacteria bacterium]|nr:hypothetical protein [Gammaproteobacteria bacterium]
MTLSSTGNTIAVGSSNKVNENGQNDFWLVNIDSQGEKIWEHHYGGDFNDEAFSIIEAGEDFLIVSGMTSSFGPTATWLMSLNHLGEIDTITPTPMETTIGEK